MQKWILRKLRLYRIPSEVISILDAVNEAINNTDSIDCVLSNEYKHAHTYSILRKKFPDMNAKHIGLAIEMVINGIQ